MFSAVPTKTTVMIEEGVETLCEPDNITVLVNKVNTLSYSNIRPTQVVIPPLLTRTRKFFVSRVIPHCFIPRKSPSILTFYGLNYNVLQSVIEIYEKDYGPLRFDEGDCMGVEHDTYYRYTIAPNISRCGTMFVVSQKVLNF